MLSNEQHRASQEKMLIEHQQDSERLFTLNALDYFFRAVLNSEQS